MGRGPTFVSADRLSPHANLSNAASLALSINVGRCRWCRLHHCRCSCRVQPAITKMRALSVNRLLRKFGKRLEIPLRRILLHARPCGPRCFGWPLNSRCAYLGWCRSTRCQCPFAGPRKASSSHASHGRNDMIMAAPDFHTTGGCKEILPASQKSPSTSAPLPCQLLPGSRKSLKCCACRCVTAAVSNPRFTRGPCTPPKETNPECLRPVTLRTLLPTLRQRHGAIFQSDIAVAPEAKRKKP